MRYTLGGMQASKIENEIRTIETTYSVPGTSLKSYLKFALEFG